MLQGVEAKVGEIRRFGMPEDAEHTTFVVEMVVRNVTEVHAFGLQFDGRPAQYPISKYTAKGKVKTIRPNKKAKPGFMWCGSAKAMSAIAVESIESSRETWIA